MLEHLQQCWVCDAAKKILTSKLSYLVFSHPTHITQTGTANRWETTNSKPPGPITMIDRSKTGSSSQIIFTTLFSGRCSTLPCLLQASANCANMLGQNHFAELNQHVLTFLHLIFFCSATYWAPVELLLVQCRIYNRIKLCQYHIQTMQFQTSTLCEWPMGNLPTWLFSVLKDIRNWFLLHICSSSSSIDAFLGFHLRCISSFLPAKFWVTNDKNDPKSHSYLTTSAKKKKKKMMMLIMGTWKIPPQQAER